MNIPALLILFLLIFGTLMLVVGAGSRLVSAQQKKKVTDILSAVAGPNARPRKELLVDTPESQEGRTAWLASFRFVKVLERRIQQAGLDWTPTAVLAATACGAVAGAFIGMQFRVPFFRELAAVGFGLLLAAIPVTIVSHKRSKRLGLFEQQFPEALDFMARSMRAGHALTVSLEMMAKESPEPLGGEFRKVFHEHNLGAPLETALRSLVDRVPLNDVRFLVAAVLLQRQTGGNLAEILTKLGYLIRERFRLKGQVKAMSAHGRITAKVLTALPIVVMFGLLVLAPGYLQSLVKDPDGKYFVVGAVVGQVLGYYTMKRIIDIKV